MVLSDGSVLVMGGFGGSSKNDVWKTVNGGASWILVTSSAGWTGKKIIPLSNSLRILPPWEKMLSYRCHLHCYSVSCVSFADVKGIHLGNDNLGPHIASLLHEYVFPSI